MPGASTLLRVLTPQQCDAAAAALGDSRSAGMLALQEVCLAGAAPADPGLWAVALEFYCNCLEAGVNAGTRNQQDKLSVTFLYPWHARTRSRSAE